jgi:hypothetical protein
VPVVRVRDGVFVGKVVRFAREGQQRGKRDGEREQEVRRTAAAGVRQGSRGGPGAQPQFQNIATQ